MRRILLSLAIIFTASASANAQSTLVGFNFFTHAGNELTSSATTVSPGISVTPVLSRAGGSPTALSANTSSNTFSSANWTNNASILGNATDTYVTFSLTTNATSQLTVNSISSLLSRSTNGPQSAQFAYSLNGGAFVNGSTVTTVGTANTTASETFASPIIVGPNTSLTFRLYGYNAKNVNPSDTLDIISTSSTSDGLFVTGSLTVVPEPTSMIALSCVGLSALGFKLRRKKVAAV